MNRYSNWLIAIVAVTGLMVASNSQAQARKMRLYQTSLEKKMGSMMKEGWKCKIALQDSNDGKGQDVELRLTMPIKEYMEFAPVAALQAASIPHKFPVVYIYLRETTTSRIGRVAFRDAEPIAGRYLAGDKDAVGEMEDAIIWH